MPLFFLHQSPPVTALITEPTLSFIYNQQQVVKTPSNTAEHIYTSFTPPWPYVNH